MGKKKFIDKKKAATFQLLARDSSDPCFDNSPGSDRVFIRVDNSSYPVDSFFADDYADSASCSANDIANSVFADASEDNEDGEVDNRFSGNSSQYSAGNRLPEHVRREILELGFPDDGYNYLMHLREIKNTGGGSAFYHNSKAKLDQLPRDVKAYDASKLQILGLNDDPDEKHINTVASKTVGVRVHKAVDPEVSALLDDSDVSRFGSDVEEFDEDFVVQANRPNEEDECVNQRLNSNVQSEAKDVLDEDHKFEHSQIMVGLDAQDGKIDYLAEAESGSAVEKPRTRRLLDEQFDLVLSQEYGSNDDDNDGYGYEAGEDEFLAEKLKNILNDNVMDDLELDDEYKVPSDVKPNNKELLDSANDVIRRCREYAEKYENGEQDQDMIVVEESSDESEVWDCETIVSTYSTLDNHPGKIKAPEVTRRKKLAEAVYGSLHATNHVISLKGKEKLPVDFLPRRRKPASEKVKVKDGLQTESQKRKQHGPESKEEKKERKAAVKEERREARRMKKETRELYRGEAHRAQRLAAVSGPSSIHLM